MPTSTFFWSLGHHFTLKKLARLVTLMRFFCHCTAIVFRSILVLGIASKVSSLDASKQRNSPHMLIERYYGVLPSVFFMQTCKYCTKTFRYSHACIKYRKVIVSTCFTKAFLFIGIVSKFHLYISRAISNTMITILTVSTLALLGLQSRLGDKPV